MKIVLALLCEFYAKNGRGSFLYRNRKAAYAPTTLTTLASLIPEELNFEVEIYDEFIEDFNPDIIEADLVGLSFTTPNANHAYKVAAILRKRGITVVFGGYHTSLLVNEAKEYADACVVGFAEKSWPKLLFDFKQNQLKKIYKEDSGKEFHNLQCKRIDLLKKKKYFFPYSIEFSRNCVNNCRFCVVPTINGTGQYHRNIELFKKEISLLKPRNLALLDSSPAENTEQFLQLCTTLKKLNVKWNCNVSLHSLGNNLGLIKTMAQSGCKGVLIGFESLCQQSLNNENKSFNKVEEYYHIVEEFHKNDIHILGTFVFGFDFDDVTVFEKTIEFVTRGKIDIANYSILTPFPGTLLYSDLEKQGRIITKNWSKYDGKHVVFQPLKMNKDELQNGIVEVYRKTFSLRSILQRTLLTRNASFKTFSSNVALGIYNLKVLVKNYE